MAKWAFKLDISDIYRALEDAKEPNYRVGAEQVVSRLKREHGLYNTLRKHVDWEDIRVWTESVEDIETADDFDSFMDKLYDWGDIEISARNDGMANRLFWVETRGG